jgi:hypothetical protein
VAAVDAIEALSPQNLKCARSSPIMADRSRSPHRRGSPSVTGNVTEGRCRRRDGEGLEGTE